MSRIVSLIFRLSHLPAKRKAATRPAPSANQPGLALNVSIQRLANPGRTDPASPMTGARKQK